MIDVTTSFCLCLRRPPSPQPTRAYRAPISAATRRMNGSDILRSPASIFSILSGNAVGPSVTQVNPAAASSSSTAAANASEPASTGSASTTNPQLMDIQIAILPSQL